MSAEFRDDLRELAEHLLNKDTKKFRQQIIRMFDKMQVTNTKKYYIEKIDKMCKLTTGETYERLFLLGIPSVEA